MTANLRADFQEKQQKRLSELIVVNPSLAKKLKTSIEKGSSSKPCRIPSIVSVPYSSPRNKPKDVENILFHGVRETITISGDDSTPSTQPPLNASADVHSREELDVLLEHFSTFVDMEPLMANMSKLFPIMQQIPINVTNDPQQNFFARIPYGTLYETIKVIMHLKDYLTMQTVELVWHLPVVFYVNCHIFHLSHLFLTFFPWFFMENYSRGSQSNEEAFPPLPKTAGG